MADAGLFAVLGGAMKGYGTGVLESAKAKREAALREVEEARADRRAQDDRDFRSKEAEIGRSAQATENDKDRASRSSEAAATRAGAGDYATTDTGDSVFVQGGVAKPVTGADGKPVKLAGTKSSDKPAEVATAEWLIQQGVAKDSSEAWKMVRNARTDPEKSRAAIYKNWLEILTKNEYGGTVKDVGAASEEAQKRTDEAMRFLDSDEGPIAPKAAGNPAATIKEATDAIAAGADKAKVRARLIEMGIDPKDAGL